MQRIYSTIALTLFLLGGILEHAAAQSETDAYRLTQRELNGSARYTSMAGAFTALGGDLSALEKNPASIGVFHKSQFAFTGQVNTQNSKSSWYNMDTEDRSSKVQMGQIGFVGSFFNARTGNGLSMAINYSQSYRVERQIDGRNSMPQIYSLADYVAAITPSDISTADLRPDPLKNYNPYYEMPWFSILGYNSGWIAPTKGARGPFETQFYYPNSNSNRYTPFGPAGSNLVYKENAKISETDFALSYNHQDMLYLGLSLKVTHVEYDLSTLYRENFIEGDYLTLNNDLRTTGRGFGGSFGLIYRPTDNLRLGMAYHTPSILHLVDQFYAEGSSRYSFALDDKGKPFPEEMWTMKEHTPQDAIAGYQLLSPSRISLGIAYTFGKRGLLSVDYELTPLGGMKIKDKKGNSLDYRNDNYNIGRHYALQQSVSVGGELYILPQMAIRAGYLYKSPAMKKKATTTSLDTQGGKSFNKMDETILTAGTLPHFMIQGATHTAACGLGYHFSKTSSLDATFLFNTRNDKLYAFSTIYDKDGKLQAHSTEPIEVKQNNFRFYLTYTLNF